MVVLAVSMFVIHLGQLWSARCILSGPSRCLQVLWIKLEGVKQHSSSSFPELSTLMSHGDELPSHGVKGLPWLSPRDVACDKP